ncbi:hypothetical protein IT568_00280 [bacterium]|nr:hypothetical protein [bacterium]
MKRIISEAVKYLTIETDLGFSFQTDIPKNKIALGTRNKTVFGSSRRVFESNLQDGDNICFRRLGDYKYFLSAERKK